MSRASTKLVITVIALLLTSFAMNNVESKAICNGKRFKDKQLGDNVKSIISLVRFQAPFARGSTVTRTLEAPFVTGNAKCSNKLSQKGCTACIDVAIKDIEKRCKNAFEVRAFASKCSITYTSKKN